MGLRERIRNKAPLGPRDGQSEIRTNGGTRRRLGRLRSSARSAWTGSFAGGRSTRGSEFGFAESFDSSDLPSEPEANEATRSSHENTQMDHPEDTEKKESSTSVHPMDMLRTARRERLGRGQGLLFPQPESYNPQPVSSYPEPLKAEPFERLDVSQPVIEPRVGLAQRGGAHVSDGIVAFVVPEHWEATRRSDIFWLSCGSCVGFVRGVPAHEASASLCNTEAVAIMENFEVSTSPTFDPEDPDILLVEYRNHGYGRG